jgi:hypothetical protein
MIHHLRLDKVHRDIFGQLFVWCSVPFFFFALVQRERNEPKEKEKPKN